MDFPHVNGSKSQRKANTIPQSPVQIVQPSPKLVAALKAFSRGASAAVVLISFSVLLGWMFDIQRLKSISPNLPSMKANAALCFVLAGIALRLLQKEPVEGPRRYVARGLTLLVGIIALLTMAEYLFVWDLGIDQLLFRDEAGTFGTLFPGRMLKIAVLNLLLFSAALICLSIERAGACLYAQYLALVAAASSMVVLIGYGYGVGDFHQLVSYTQVPLNTALISGVFAVGVLCTRPDRGIMALVTSEGVGGLMLRRGLPATIGIPLVLGWLRLEGQRAGLYGTEFGITLLASTTLVLLAGLLWFYARSIEAAEIEQREAEREIRILNEELEQRAVKRTAQLQERTKQLESLNKELEAFTYSVAHDLRSPLRRIDGFAQLLLEEYSSGLPDKARHYIDRMQEGTLHMGELVDDLLNLARVGRKDVNLQVTGIGSLVDEVMVDLKPETDGRAIEWKIRPLPFVECDPALMKVVFTNLLSNAVKYTRPRQQTIIEVGTIEQDGHPVLFVRDNGVGFSMKYADKLFGVFQRLHRVEDFEGTGIGLATVQRIVHKHGGQIWAEAELDKGACFYFTIGTQPQIKPETQSGSGKERDAGERCGNSVSGG